MADQLFSVTIPDGTIAFMERTVGKASTRQAMYQAVKRTTAAAKRQIMKAVTADVNINAKYVTRAIRSTVLGGSKDGGEAPEGVVRISGKSIPLVAFHPTYDKAHGITVIMVKSKGPLILRHAFFANTRNMKMFDLVVDAGYSEGEAKDASFDGGHKGVFTRKEKVGAAFSLDSRKLATKAQYYGRLPIQEEKGPNLATIIGPEKLTATGENVMAGLRETLRVNLQSQLDRFLNQKKGAGVQLPEGNSNGG